jgi:hypothetical protein
MTSTQKNTITKGMVAAGLGFGAYYFFTVYVRQIGVATSLSTIKPPNAITKAISLLKQNKTGDTASGGNSGKLSPSQYTLLSGYAKTIYEALHYVWSDDWNTIWSTFQKLQSQADVTNLVIIFTALYNLDLWTYLQDGNGYWVLGDGLSDSHLQQLQDYVDKLPKLKPAVNGTGYNCPGIRF